MQTSDMNYTNVCWYCGRVYKSNRSTSKYCCSKHNSLYSQYGPAIQPGISKEGAIDFNPILECIYREDINKDKLNTAPGFLLHTIREGFEYRGPLPVGDEILLVGSYVIKRNNKLSSDELDIFYVKPFILLTKEERRCAIIMASKTQF